MKQKVQRACGLLLGIIVLKILLDGIFVYVWDMTPADMLAEWLRSLS